MTVPVGENYPVGPCPLPWSCRPPSSTPEELPAEADLPIVFALGGTPSGEWGGYVAISSVMAAILVRHCFSAVPYLLQVRRGKPSAKRPSSPMSPTNSRPH